MIETLWHTSDCSLVVKALWRRVGRGRKERACSMEKDFPQMVINGEASQPGTFGAAKSLVLMVKGLGPET